jgi:hypothetical protein
MCFPALRNSSGSLAMFVAIRLALVARERIRVLF